MSKRRTDWGRGVPIEPVTGTVAIAGGPGVFSRIRELSAAAFDTFG